MDVYSLIQQDHRRIMELMDLLEASESAEQRHELVQRLILELETHREAEEKTLYAVLSAPEAAGELVEEAMEVHADMEEMVEEIGDIEEDDDAFLDKLAHLRQVIRQHIEREETEMFERSRELVTDSEAVELAQKMNDGKRSTRV
jgi:hemerythrin-like domain-containing protein